MRLTELPQHELIADKLRELAEDKIDCEAFWEALVRYGLSHEDIHRFCCGERLDEDRPPSPASDRRHAAAQAVGHAND